MAGSAPDDDDRLAEAIHSRFDMSEGPSWILANGEEIKAWSDIYKGQRVLWWIGTHVKIGTVLAHKGIGLRVHFDGDIRPTNIPNARSYFVAHRMGKREQNLYCVRPTMRIKGKDPAVSKKSRSKHTTSDTLDGDLISSGEAVKLYGISGKELRRLLRTSKVLGKQEDGHWMVDATSLGRYLADRR